MLMTMARMALPTVMITEGGFYLYQQLRKVLGNLELVECTDCTSLHLSHLT